VLSLSELSLGSFFGESEETKEKGLGFLSVIYHHHYRAARPFAVSETVERWSLFCVEWWLVVVVVEAKREREREEQHDAR